MEEPSEYWMQEMSILYFICLRCALKRHQTDEGKEHEYKWSRSWYEDHTKTKKKKRKKRRIWGRRKKKQNKHKTHGIHSSHLGVLNCLSLYSVFMNISFNVISFRSHMLQHTKSFFLFYLLFLFFIFCKSLVFGCDFAVY